MPAPPGGTPSWDPTPIVVFHDHQIDLAGSALRRIAPGFVSGIEGRARQHMDILGGPPLSQHGAQQFARYRELLGLTYELELAIHQLRAATELLQHPGPADHLVPIDIKESERFYHHLQMWTFASSSLFDRTRHVVVRTSRRLIKRNNPQTAAAIESKLVADIKTAEARVKHIRDSFAHGGGVFAELATSGHFDVAAAARIWPSTRMAPDAMFRHRAKYLIDTRNGALLHLSDVGTIIGELDGAVDWDALKASH